MFIRPSMISENDNTLLNPADTLENPVFFDRKPRIEEGGRSKDISADERLPFSTKHLLKQTDLLLKSKGESGFVDLSKGYWNPSHRYVASHHFIVMSVKSNILEHLGIEFSYVTGILRFVLEVELKKRYSFMKYENEMKMKEMTNFNILKQNTVDDKNKIDKKPGFGISKRSFFSMQPALSIEELKSKQIAVPVNKESQWAIIDKFYRLEDLKRRVEATMIIWEQNFSNVNKGEL
jgi:hypothetical protein